MVERKKGKRPFKDSGLLDAAEGLSKLYPHDPTLMELADTLRGLDKLSIGVRKIQEALGIRQPIPEPSIGTPKKVLPLESKLETGQRVMMKAVGGLTDNLKGMQKNQERLLHRQEDQEWKSNLGLVFGGFGLIGFIIAAIALIKTLV